MARPGKNNGQHTRWMFRPFHVFVSGALCPKCKESIKISFLYRRGLSLAGPSFWTNVAHRNCQQEQEQEQHTSFKSWEWSSQLKIIISYLRSKPSILWKSTVKNAYIRRFKKNLDENERKVILCLRSYRSPSKKQSNTSFDSKARNVQIRI